MRVAIADPDRATPPLRAVVEAKRDAIRAAVARHHGRRVRLFGSAARGEDRPGSDVDLLVDFDAESSLFDLIRLTRELKELLGLRVDVVSTGGLKERDKRILAGAIDL